MLKPGQLATCRIDTDKIILWESYECEIDDVTDLIDASELVVIIDAVKSIKSAKLDSNLVSEAWENGAYKVMSPRGICGWVGASWIISVD